MTLAVGTNIQIGTIDESAWGTTPASGTFQKVRVTTVSPKQDRSTVQSQELTTAREIADYILTEEKGGITFNHELSYGNLDSVLESLAGGTWATDVLKIGTTQKSHAIELGFTDIAKYCLFNGAIANAVSVTVQRGQIVGGSVGYSSKVPTWSGTSIVDGSAIVAAAAPTNAVMDPISSLQLLQEGGSGAIANPQEFSMNLSNGLIEFPQLGDVDPADLQYGQFKAEGTFTTYFADTTYIDKVVSYADTSLAVTLGGASATKYAILFNKVKLQTYELSSIQVNGAVLAKIAWAAKVDATNTTMKITRTA